MEKRLSSTLTYFQRVIEKYIIINDSYSQKHNMNCLLKTSKE